MTFTYGELKTAIQDYTQNDETTFVNNLPTFVRLTEEKIFKIIQLELFRKNVITSFASANQFLGVPSDFISPISFSFTNTAGDKVFLEYKDVNYLQSFHPDATETGTPRYYAFFDINNFILAPTPDTAHTAELHYVYRPASLTAGSDSGTTWLSENAEIALLYGSLVEAYTFMKGEADVMANYNQQFEQALMGLKLLGDSKETTDFYRTGQVITPKR